MALFVYVPAMLEPGDEVAAVAQCSTMKSPLQKVSGLARLPSALKDGKAHCTSVLPLCTTKPADRFAAHAQASFGLKLCAVTVGTSGPAFSGRWLWREKR